MAGAAAGYDDSTDPSNIVGSRESVRLAFVAALQHLSPRQRAVLVLRDVLQWKAAEVADAIGASTAAVNSLLQRARAQLDAVGPSEDDQLAPPDSPETKDLLDRYIAAFEAYDVDKLVELFTQEAIWEMPPFDGWYQAPQAIATLIRTHCPAEKAGDMRLLPTTANGQPAAALYMRNKETGLHEAFQFHVIDVGRDGVSHVVAFVDTVAVRQVRIARDALAVEWPAYATRSCKTRAITGHSAPAASQRCAYPRDDHTGSVAQQLVADADDPPTALLAVLAYLSMSRVRRQGSVQCCGPSYSTPTFNSSHPISIRANDIRRSRRRRRSVSVGRGRPDVNEQQPSSAFPAATRRPIHQLDARSQLDDPACSGDGRLD